MATYNWGLDKGFLADVDLSASQYYFVIPASTAGYVKIAATAAASVLGVLQNDPKAGEVATVRMLGFSKVRANAESAASPIVFGGLVKSGSHGQAVGALNPAASSITAGVAMEAYSSGSGAYIEIFLLPSGIRA
jgi:hypothetical protein